LKIDAEIGEGTKVWHYCNLFKCKIGKNCVIGSYVEIGRNVTIGDNCKIECGVFIPEGVTIEDEVFIGPHVVFTNDRFPKAKTEHWEITKTIIKKGASIGANSTIRCGITIGENALIGCGSVVTKDVPDNEVWVGNPAKAMVKSRKT
jgi:UDP-2-acetamido-3-amino-2,3-dideoxy-glucuronate N-acetyltransferase